MHDDGYFSEPVAERYDERYAYLTEPAVADPMVDCTAVRAVAVERDDELVGTS